MRSISGFIQIIDEREAANKAGAETAGFCFLP